MTKNNNKTKTTRSGRISRPPQRYTPDKNTFENNGKFNFPSETKRKYDPRDDWCLGCEHCSSSPASENTNNMESFDHWSDYNEDRRNKH